jgi:SAP domain-containing new25/Domain of unknown function (DUF6434)
MRPKLNKDITIPDFRNYYWLKEELQQFCRINHLGVSGSKAELNNRIEKYLLTGDIEKPARKRLYKGKPNEKLSLDTVINENHRCSQEVRAFFKSVIPNFHFSTYIQKFFKNNIGKTYRDAIQAWYEEEKRKKEPDYRTEIAPQFEYNQFIRDFFADPMNTGKTKGDAIAAWKKIRSIPGSNKYSAFHS